jgi:DNA replication protein DnaC
MRKLTGIQLPIIDDLARQRLVVTETSDFYQVCVEQHQETATVVTSNSTMEEWLPMMADRPLAQCAIDRLVSTAHELIIEGGESYSWRSAAPVSCSRRPKRSARANNSAHRGANR